MITQEIEILEVLQGDVVRISGRAYTVTGKVLTGDVVALFVKPVGNRRAGEALLHAEAYDLVEVIRD